VSAKIFGRLAWIISALAIVVITLAIFRPF
jgi:hypothetical protein